MKRVVVLCALAFALNGCAFNDTWKPVIDPGIDPVPKVLSRDYTYCEKLAQQSAVNSGKISFFGSDESRRRQKFTECLILRGHVVYID